jgi:hypothetical protein
VLSALLLQVSMLVGVLVLLPLIMLQRGGLRALNAGRTSPSRARAWPSSSSRSAPSSAWRCSSATVYSTTVVVFSFLFAGLGSLWAGRYAATPTRAVRVSAGLLVAVILLFSLAAQPILDSCLQLEAALARCHRRGPHGAHERLHGHAFRWPWGGWGATAELVPWALGVGGGAGVVGTVLSVMIAMGSASRRSASSPPACTCWLCWRRRQGRWPASRRRRRWRRLTRSRTRPAAHGGTR